MGKWKKRLLQVIVTLVLLALGVFGMQKITASRQDVKRRKPPVPVPTVRVMDVKATSHRVVIEGEGTVRPLDEIRLIPQVGGKVISISPALVNGGQFSKGDVLLRIDPVDYQLALALAEAKVKDGESRLQIAQEESAAAKEEWRINHPGGSKKILDPPPLVAKEPQ
ncbi:MAG: biotin/lipoyl-binding protein, partial [Deltaproteobacteria bacterium]|nr:biotin/lipoyl-binding protein [Deltaproteobacteria bacterium]